MPTTHDTPARKDVCYGPIAPGQYFVDRMNPITPQTWKAVGDLIEGVLICEMWGMNEDRWVWSFGKRPDGGGFQIAICNLENMERVTKSQAREYAIKELRRRDDEWCAQWDSTRGPVKIIRCVCGVGDDAEVMRHTVGCARREDW